MGSSDATENLWGGRVMLRSLRKLFGKKSLYKKAQRRFRRLAFFETLESRRVLDGVAPFAYGDAYVTQEDVSLQVVASGVLANDRDAGGNVLRAAVVSGPKRGNLSFNADGSFVYVPKNDGSGLDTFTYSASNGTKASNVATVTVNVVAVNDPPVANADAYSTKEDVTLKVSTPGVLRNDTDVDSKTRTAILKTSPIHGSLTLNANGSFVYSPSANFNGADRFTYAAWDGLAESLPATVNIAITPVNDAPVAFNDAFTTLGNQSFLVARPGVLINDVDVDGDSLTAQIVTRPSHGTIAVNGDGSFSYIPVAGFSGSDLFTYRTYDGTTRSAAATVTLTIVPGNQPPQAANDSYDIAEDVVLAVTAPGILGNDTDVDSTVLFPTVASDPSNGSLTLKNDGSFTYVPASNWSGTDSFTYRISDGKATSGLATVSIAVSAVNDAPTAVGDSYETAEDVVLAVSAPGLLGNDTDVDSSVLSATVASDPSNGSLTLKSDGSFTYVPASNWSGTDSFTYRVSDGKAASNLATVSINVSAVNDAPTAVGDFYETAEDVVLAVSAPGLLGNDTDVDSSVLSATVASDPSNGSLTLKTDGSFTYVPASNWSGTDSFTYRVSDGEAASDLATVSITVSAVNDAPTAVGDFYETAAGSTLSVGIPGVLGNDTDVDGDALVAQVEASPTHGALTLKSDGTFTYTAAANWSGDDSFTYHVSDGTLQSAAATVSLRVTPVNTAPVAAHDAYTVTSGQTLNIAAPGVLSNDSDANGDSLTAALETSASHGTVTMSAGGAFTYVPSSGYTGSDSFTYRVSDGRCFSNSATVDILVSPLNVTYITDAWLNSQGAAPYILSKANTTYVLQTDVTVDGSGFVVGAAGVTLDLNGHTLTYGNAARPNLINAGFEDGSGNIVPGWDLTNAPNASVAPNSRYLWGNSVLALSNMSTTQTVMSDAIALTSAGHEYVATITPAGPYDSSVALSVIDAATGAVLGTASSPAVNRGFAPVVTFTPARPMAVQLKVTVTPASGKTQTVYLDYASLDLSHDYGIVASPSTWYFPSPLKDSSTITSAARNAKAFRVQNGDIVQGVSQGYESYAIYATSLGGLTVDTVHITVSGIDTDAVFGQWVSNASVVFSVFDNHVDKITDRMHKGNVLSLGAAGGSVVVEGNTINGAPRASVYISRSKSVVIRNNQIHSNSIVTEGYGILASGIQNFEISGNTITTQKSGRGILLDALSSDGQPSVNGEIFSNTVDIVERPNVEYGASLEATALRLRAYTERGHQDIRIHNNTFTARTTTGYVKAAIGARLTYLADKSHLPLGVSLADNVFKALVDTTDSTYWARAFTLEGVVPDVGLEMRTNVFESNDISLGLGGNDGSDAASSTFVSNTVRQSSEGASRNYKSIYIGQYNGTISDIRLIDMRFEGGATSNIAWTGTGLKDIYTGWLLDVQVADSRGIVLAGATIEILDRDGNVVSRGVTDAAGLSGDLALLTTAFRQSGTSPNIIVSETRGPHSVRVVLDGFLPFDQLIDLQASTTFRVVLTQ